MSTLTEIREAIRESDLNASEKSALLEMAGNEDPVPETTVQQIIQSLQGDIEQIKAAGPSEEEVAAVEKEVQELVKEVEADAQAKEMYLEIESEFQKIDAEGDKELAAAEAELNKTLHALDEEVKDVHHQMTEALDEADIEKAKAALE